METFILKLAVAVIPLVVLVASVTIISNSISISKRPLRWLVFGSSTYYLYAFVTSILAALSASLIWNRNSLSSWYTHHPLAWRRTRRSILRALAAGVMLR